MLKNHTMKMSESFCRNIELDETDDELSMNEDPVQDLSDEERNDGKSSFELLEAVRAIIPTKVYVHDIMRQLCIVVKFNQRNN